MNTKINNFLIDDVRALINAINNNAELAAMEIRKDGGSFDTLADFAAYWSTHINEIENEIINKNK